MKITVFGGTRGTGAHLVRLALAEGHDVEVVARRPEAVTERHPRLTVRQGDVLEPETLTVGAADAVVFLAGPSGGGPTRVYSLGGGNVAQAMARQGVRRLVAVTNALGNQPADTVRQRLLKLVLHNTFLRHGHRDARLFERELRGRDLDWTVVQPPRLTDAPATGTYRTAVEDSVRGGVSISREDLAGYVLRVIAAPETYRKVMGVAY
ncbi:NAD(P)H-binding protein [Microtetraspora sp. AC03309]|uniref:NAD(P)-dependent oxidoreductase n=1 Tax=Microtetraspora sp. AC03309 TaxID=2779376 RepID=UPI001E48E3EA|nr:NAD(P)H-binding protein [Microtetraspora sp. AC03309]MCC5578672.1 NAD(P)H-binding protein [Microtetraspora sp. AC03309]